MIKDTFSKQQEREIKNEVKHELEKEVGREIDKKVDKEIDKQLSKRLLTMAKHPVIIVGNEFKQHVSTAIVAAFGFLIAIAWKDLIVKIMEKFTKNLAVSYPYIAELYSAILVTFVSVICILIISRWAKKSETPK